MKHEAAFRKQLREFVDWKQAHVDFDTAVDGIAPRLRGVVPSGFQHSIWQLVEHLRIAQNDILDFCRNPKYAEKKWPDEYWPKTPAPEGDTAWDASLAAYRRDRRAMQRLASNSRLDLFKKIPHGHGQTYLREVLLVADHAAYHIAQIVDVRRALGEWRG